MGGIYRGYPSTFVIKMQFGVSTDRGLPFMEGPPFLYQQIFLVINGKSRDIV